MRESGDSGLGKWLILLLLLLNRFNHIRLCATPETAAHQAPPSLWFSGKNSGVGCHFLLQCVKVKSESEVTQSCLLATPWTAAYQAPPSMGFSRQEYWSGMHCLLQINYGDGAIIKEISALIEEDPECYLMLFIMWGHKEKLKISTVEVVLTRTWPC